MADKNMTIPSPLFKGNLKVQGLAMETDKYGVHYGFIVDPASTDIGFGCVVQKGAGDNLVKAGASATAGAVYGISCYSDAIATNRPASNSKYIAGMPIDVMLDGYLWFYPTTTTGVSKTSKVLGNLTTGEVTFGDSATSGTNVELTWCKVVLVDEGKKRVLVRVDATQA